MDFVSTNELKRLKAQCDDAFRKFSSRSIGAEALASLTPDFSYYLIAGSETQSVTEGVSVAGDGSYVAVLLRIGETTDMKVAEGNFHEGNYEFFSNALEVARQEFTCNARVAA